MKIFHANLEDDTKPESAPHKDRHKVVYVRAESYGHAEARLAQLFPGWTLEYIEALSSTFIE
jgi:hypothetical protein